MKCDPPHYPINAQSDKVISRPRPIRDEEEQQPRKRGADGAVSSGFQKGALCAHTVCPNDDISWNFSGNVLEGYQKRGQGICVKCTIYRSKYPLCAAILGAIRPYNMISCSRSPCLELCKNLINCFYFTLLLLF